MKQLVCLIGAVLVINTAAAETTRGTKPLGNRTLGQPSYPNSGQLRNRSNDMTGEDMSNASLMGSDKNPTVPQRNPTAVQERQESETSVGPYNREGEYQHLHDEPERGE